MKKYDPKYLGIPNICFSLTDKTDDREPNYKLQRLARGFDDSETWSLSDTIANFIIPRLELFLEITEQHVDENNFRQSIQDFLIAMKLVARDEGARVYTDEERLILNKGLEAFPDIFMGLWW